MHRYTHFTAATLAWFSCTLAGAEIYVCTDGTGHRTYSDLGCPDKQIYTPAKIPPVTFTPIAPSDVKRLQQSARELAQTRQALKRQRDQERKALQAQSSQREQACAQAKADLAALAHKRRKGYSLTSLPDLDVAHDRLKQRKRENC